MAWPLLGTDNATDIQVMPSPEFAQRFDFDDWSFDSDNGLLQLHYVLENHGRVTEQYDFGSVDPKRLPQIQPALNPAIQLLHWMAGVSYYKTGLACETHFNPQQPNAAVATWHQQNWYHGLGELAYEHALSLAATMDIAPSQSRRQHHTVRSRPHAPVPHGSSSRSSGPRTIQTHQAE